MLIEKLMGGSGDAGGPSLNKNIYGCNLIFQHRYKRVNISCLIGEVGLDEEVLAVLGVETTFVGEGGSFFIGPRTVSNGGECDGEAVLVVVEHVVVAAGTAAAVLDA